ncbi:formate dehydrogenase accessory sulfurtransferase FdhD [bacterium AH-315-N03]|nr:formate dehydrogenase accessory sulfurtransferase FdhD [bacterium AH-315-N03]
MHPRGTAIDGSASPRAYAIGCWRGAGVESALSMQNVTQRKVSRDGEEEELDSIAVEEPLEIRVAGDALAITMRSPGEDRFLAVGFLHAEGVIESIADVGSVAHCGRPDEEGFGNVIDVTPGPGVVLDPSKLELSRRGTLTTASCGICGRRSIDDLIGRVGPVGRNVSVARAVIAAAPDRLLESQRAFATTGGVHAAAAHRPDGSVVAHAEDVGRHNAVDKVVGKLLYEATLEEVAFLMVSGRVSFEIVQKAAAARVPIVAAVSAPTSLAIDLAERAEITLLAFVRGGRMNVYCHAHRLG